METVVFDTVVRGSTISIPPRFSNRHVKIIIIDEESKAEPEKPAPRKLNFKIDETLEDVVPFSGVDNVPDFARELREKHWGRFLGTDNKKIPGDPARLKI